MYENFDDTDFDDTDEDEIIGYACMGCGHVQDNATGFGCEKCTGQCLDPIFF